MTATQTPSHQETWTPWVPPAMQPRPRSFTTSAVVAIVAVVATVALVVGLVIGAIGGAACKGHADQRSICQQEGTLSHLNSSC